MKRCIPFILMILLVHFFLCATTDTRSMAIQGVLGDVHTITVTPISASEEGGDGMPFSLLADDVKASPGHTIANWTMMTNYLPVTVRVAAEHLESDALNSVGRRAYVHYVLRFGYEYPVYDENDDFDLVLGSFTVASVEPGTEVTEVEDSMHTFTFSRPEDGFQGIELLSTGQCVIAFYLDETVVESIGTDVYPYGSYSATVTIMLESDE